MCPEKPTVNKDVGRVYLSPTLACDRIVGNPDEAALGQGTSLMVRFRQACMTEPA